MSRAFASEAPDIIKFLQIIYSYYLIPGFIGPSSDSVFLAWANSVINHGINTITILLYDNMTLLAFFVKEISKKYP